MRVAGLIGLLAASIGTARRGAVATKYSIHSLIDRPDRHDEYLRTLGGLSFPA